MRDKPWIGVDLDGTLATYETWESHTHIGKPVEPMVDRVKHWLWLGYDVKVFTARMSDPDAVRRGEIAAAIQKWTKRHIGVALQATCVKDYAMLELWDDRAVQVEANTGQPVGYSTRGFK